jgi:hypothetical protein
MAGVEILTSAQVVAESTFNWTAFWITCSLCFLFFLFVGIGLYMNRELNGIEVLFISSIGLLLGGMIGAGFGIVASSPVSYTTEYKVTISDEVSMTEFYEHYEVIEQDGKIFTVKEINND